MSSQASDPVSSLVSEYDAIIVQQEEKQEKNEVPSRLLLLPIELQLQIFESVYEDVVIHLICFLGKGLSHFLCYDGDPIHKNALGKSQFSQCRCHSEDFLDDLRRNPCEYSFVWPRPRRAPKRLAGLHLTCKEM